VIIGALFRPEFSTWVLHAQSLGFTEFVTPEDGFSTELTSNKVWGGHSSCGVYTWITETGDAYVGQTLKVRARLRQHWKFHRSIVYAAFQPVERDNLNVEEPRLIAAMETAFPVLNITFAKSSTTRVPFDEVVTQDERKEFLNGGKLAENIDWPQWPLLVRKQNEKFKYLTTDDLCYIVLNSIRTYVERCIPKPRSTEVRFWSVTVLNDSPHYFRLNVGQQEVFTLWTDETVLYARVLAKEKLVEDAEGPFYVTNSFDNFVPIAELDIWLAGENLTACRELVTWLMRHTVPLHSRSHCPQVVRAAFADPSPTIC
jgi:hypothetical protein